MMNLFHRRPNSSIGSSAQFEGMYEQNRLSVFRYIYGLTGGPQEAVEDLTAETFLRAWKARHRYEGNVEAAIGWLIRIAKRLVIDEYRRTLQTTRHLTAAPVAVSMPEQVAMADEQKDFLFALLAGLSEEQRELIVLRYILGWRVTDIALYVGATENNISVMIHRTLSRLREKWAEADAESLSVVFAQEEKSS